MSRPPLSSKRHFSEAKGFTLVEAMVATVVFSMAILGVYACMVKSYQLSSITRYNDQARSILLSYVDQFERLQTVSTGSGTVRPFFNPTSLPTGNGLTWPGLSSGDTSTTNNSINVTLGDSSNGSASVTATVTRSVYPLKVPSATQAEDGTYGTFIPYYTAPSAYSQAPGYLVAGIFTISYTIKSSGKQYTQRLIAIRAVP